MQHNLQSNIMYNNVLDKPMSPKIRREALHHKKHHVGKARRASAYLVYDGCIRWFTSVYDECVCYTNEKSQVLSFALILGIVCAFVWKSLFGILYFGN
jgi:hypothetical protein